MKVARTVWSGGKLGDYIKELPIAIELSEIYEKNIKTFYSIALSNLHNKQDAEDAIQEAFLSVAKNPSAFFNIPQKKRVSYMDVIVRNISYRIWN